MKRAVVLLLPTLLALTAARADEGPSFVVRVNRAIDRGAAQLVREQHEDGSWNKDDKVHPLGRTALCTFALLHAGYPEDHEAVKKALAFLGIDRGYAHWKKPISTYEAGCLVLMLNALGRQHGRQINEICQWLCDNFNWNAGLWGYPDGTPDLSNTQYAVLGLKAGERHGFRTPKKIWKRLINTIIERFQSRTGGMRYRPESIYRGSMTHAGCLTLLFAYQGLGLKRPPPEVKAALRKAHRWFEESYSVERHPSGRGWAPDRFYYYMYGLERYAIFFGLEEIAGHDWYREGAEVLIERQGRRGAWGRLEETCFAILFLRKATFSKPRPRLFSDGEGDEGQDPPPRPRPEEGVAYLRDWLVAGPYCGEKGEDDQLYEEHLDPKRTTPVADGPAGKMNWVRYTSQEDKIDLSVATRGMAWASWYAATYLHADEEMSAVLWCDSDDGLRVWLNGEEVLFGHHHGHCGHDFYRVPVKLEKGRNTLLLQVENLEHYAYFKARISDEKGWPVTGVTDSTKPRVSKAR